MKFHFKKIASVLASAVMLGSTLGIAAAANYPAPFVAGGKADVAIVVGSAALASDYVAAVDLGSNLQAELAKQTATTTGGSSASATGGDSINLATSTQKLFFDSNLTDARTVLTKSELPTLLADGTILDDGGTEYTYTQQVTPGGDIQVDYSTSGSDFDDPEMILEIGTTTDTYLYQYKVTFNKPINLTSTDVQGNDIEILGKKYTIGANSISTTAATSILYLYGEGESKTLNEGESVSVNIGGEEHTVELVGVDSNGASSIRVDGGTIRDIDEGSSSKVGGLEIYVKNSFYSAKESSNNYAQLHIGTDKLTLDQGTTVKQGSDDTSIYGTDVGFTISSVQLSALEVNVSMQKSTKDYIKAGEEYADPIFGGMLVNFASVTPALDAETRDKILVDTDNNLNARVTFTSALAGTSGETTFSFMKDIDSAEGTVTPRVANSGNRTIHLQENESVKLNEYMVINSGDFGRIVQLTEGPDGNAIATTDKIQLTDAITGENLLGSSGLSWTMSGNEAYATTNVDGQPYYFSTDRYDNKSVQITWGAGAGQGDYGTQKTIFPRIKLKNGGWLAFTTVVNVPTGITVSLPGTETLTTYESGVVFDAEGQGGVTGNVNGTKTGAGIANVTVGNLNWTYSHLHEVANTNYTINNDTAYINNGSAYILGVGPSTQKGSTNAFCTFNFTGGYDPFEGTGIPGYPAIDSKGSYDGAILFQEEKKSTESGNSDQGDAICIPLDLSSGTSPIEISIGSPKVTGIWSGLTSLQSDSYKQRGVTRYGTYIEYDSTNNDAVTVWYPTEQMYADILFTEEGVTVTPGSAGSGSVSELGSVTVEDSEVSSVSGKNLVVVGGSCINTVAGTILGSACGADFTAKTGINPDQFLVKVVTSPYASDKVAMLIAGYEAADTTSAVKYVTTEKPSTAVDTEIKKTTGTYTDVE